MHKEKHTHIYCNGSLFSNMTIKNNNIKDNYKLNIPYILVLVIMSSSLKTRGEGKQQKRNFHEEEFQRLLLITATFCSAIGFHNFQNARSPFLPVGIHLERIIKNKKNEEERIARLIFFEAKKKKRKKEKALEGDAKATQARLEAVTSCASWNKRIGSMWEAVDDTKHTFFMPPIRGRG